MQSIIMWQVMLLLISVGFFPLTEQIFSKWKSRGWIYAGPLGLFLAGWGLWMLNCLHVVRFTGKNALLAVLIMSVIIWAAALLTGRIPKLSASEIGSAAAEEVLFLAFYVLMVWVIGFRPEAYGTEKFMDYGFLTVMARSEWMPFEDPWYSGYTVNYYYGGQYLTAFLMKMSGSAAGVSYNLMRATITSYSFVLPFSFVRQLLSDRLNKAPGAANGGGILAGMAAAVCGNGHYLVYGVIRPLLGIGSQMYWFPDSTRYIGYDPDLPDKTIHEFPAYSSVLGDLHAHYINLIFVMTIAAVIYAWAQHAEKRTPIQNSDGRVVVLSELFREIRNPVLLLIGFMTGAFRWTNFWDFPIYFVVAGAVLFFVHLKRYGGRIREWLSVMAGSAAVMFLSGYLAALPFTSTFYQISSEIGRTHSHTRLYQLGILWGIPVSLLICLILLLISEGKKSKTAGNLFLKISALQLPDLTVLLYGLCAAGLVWLPEVIYVKDIYGSEHYRANTMFKLTYQAFILFAVVMAYTVIRILRKNRRAWKTVGIIGLLLVLATGGYGIQASVSWFGNVLDAEQRIGTDASVFISEYYPSDYEAVNWLNTHVHGTAVVLEAPGDSYSDYERISVATGLPTVAGWYVHEWLWRGGHEALDERLADIQAIYEGTDAEYTRELIEKYRIRYLYIGSPEREKYPNLQENVLRTIGEVVFDGENGTYILQVRDE